MICFIEKNEIKQLESNFITTINIMKAKIANQGDTGGCSFVGGLYNLYRCHTNQYNTTRFLKKYLVIWDKIQSILEKNNKLVFKNGDEAVVNVYDTIALIVEYKTKKYRFKENSTHDTTKITIYSYRKSR